MTVEAKNIREDIARARAAAQKNDLLKTLEYLRDAAKGAGSAKVFGREKFEIEALLVEALKDLNRLKTMQKVLPNGVNYQRGKERELFVLLHRLHEKLRQAIDKARIRRERERMNRLDELLGAARAKLREKEEMEARKLFRRAAEEFKDVPGLLSDIGTRMVMGGLVAEAVEYLGRAIELNNRDQRAHQSLIMCHEALGDLAKAEDAVNTAIRFLGASEPLYIKLASIALARSEWDTALQAAERVLKNNPLSIEARKTVAKARPKVYRSAQKAQVAAMRGQAPAASGGGGGGSGKEIKLDF